MYEAINIAATGLKHQQRRLDVIANNVANVNSAAFKSDRLDFKDALYTTGIVPNYPRTPAPEGNQQKGHGVMIAGITKDYSTGSFQRTDRELDVAIEGEGFFELEDPNGNIVYSRNGSFELGEGGDGMYLVNGDGWYIHDDNGMRIGIPDDTGSIAFDTDGTITFTVDGEETTAKLGLFTFRNLTGLMSVGNGNLGETEASGEKMPVDGTMIRQGEIEISNVKLSEEMTRIIRTQRVFQLSSRALTTADEMEAIANNLRR
ncbi:MAG: flagellar hook-basal body protein [Oscillospiraceae bacterium]|jgi:flagellar basal-body rod protein FlgG|nr:flagellar hook-basal body protein [Oscillospiraceae bacterium]